MASFCPSSAPSPARKLDSTAEDFLRHLDLPLVHPLCGDGVKTSADATGVTATEDVSNDLSFIGGGVFELPSVTVNDTSLNNDVNIPWLTSQLLNQQPPPPSVGSISLMELHDQSIWELALTATTMSAPTMAMAELWLRFFAVFLSPLCLAWMVQWDMSRNSVKQAAARGNTGVATIVVSIVGLASSAVLFTDSLYVYEYGRWFGFSLFVLSSIMAVRCAASVAEDKGEHAGKGKGKTSRASQKSNAYLLQYAIYVFIAMTTVIFMRSDGGHAMDSLFKRILPTSPVHSTDAETITNNIQNGSYNPIEHMPHPGIDIPTIDEGLYHSASNPFVSSVVSHWDPSSYTYNIQNGATPYLVNGDQRTGIPFLVNGCEEQEYVRVWTQSRFDGEYLALDIAFPYSSNDDGQGDLTKAVFVHDLSKPVYLVLHGLNGGSHEEYVKDFVKRRRAEGSTVIVLIARGMMDTQLIGWNGFHGARTGDVDIAARAVRKGLISLAEAHQRPKRQVLTGVGYSMGAIILSNYMARSGTHCALDAAMAISGGLDMRQQLSFKRSMRLWQPMLTFGLREDILVGKYARHYKSRLTKQQFLNLLRVTSISALDVQAIVTYNDFDHLYHYYSEMSAMGDRDPEFDLFGPADTTSSGDHSSWGRMADVSKPFAVLQALDDPLVGWRTIGTNNPQALADSGSGNVILALTKAGGHVGWPLGNNPKKNSWKWMNDAARDFALAVDKATQLE